MLLRLSKTITFVFVCILSLIIFSCKSSFPSAGTAVECNGQLLIPILNPDKNPHFPEGGQTMYEFMGEKWQFPEEAKNGKIKGTVRVAFIVTKEGNICDVRITSKPQKYLDEEVLRVMKLMPKWIPGENKGEIVDSYYLMDVRFG